MVGDLLDVMNFHGWLGDAFIAAVLTERIANQLEGSHAAPCSVVAALAGRKAGVGSTRVRGLLVLLAATAGVADQLAATGSVAFAEGCVSQGSVPEGGEMNAFEGCHAKALICEIEKRREIYEGCH
jgi:hypothetical protein